MQITICSDHAEFPDLKLTTFSTKPIFERLRAVSWRGRAPHSAHSTHAHIMAFWSTILRRS